MRGGSGSPACKAATPASILTRAAATLCASWAPCFSFCSSRLPLAIAEISGGSKRNAIPREASATVLDAAGEPELRSLVAAVEADFARISARSIPA